MSLSKYARFLVGLRGILFVARLTKFSLIVSLLASLAILLPEQALEALRVAAEDAATQSSEQTPRPIMLLMITSLFLCLMSWYWARVLIYLNRPRWMEAGGAHGWAARNLPRLCGIVPLISLAFAFYRASDPRIVQRGAAQRLLIVLFIVTLVESVLLYLFFYLRGRFINRPTRRLSANAMRLAVRRLDLTGKIILAFTALLGVSLFIIFSLSAGRSAQWLGTTALIFLALGSWIPLGSVLVHWGRLTRVPFLALLLVAALLFSAFDLNDNHMIRHQRESGRPLPPEFSLAFTQWLENRADLNEYDTYPVFIVSAEGGGLRAAYFTALVLASLQDRCPRFAQHTFVISGVSGGSLGAAVFAGLAARSARNEPGLPCNMGVAEMGAMERQADVVLRRDFLSPILGAALYPDLLQRFLPVPINGFDRALALEQGLEQSWKDATGSDEFADTFSNLWQDFPRQATPALFLNTTRVETGDRMVISNLYPLHERFNRLSSLADVDPSITLRLSTAAFLSARFPVVTPAGFIPIGRDRNDRWVEKQRYVDGGYFENSGAATLYDILSVMRAPDGMPKPKYMPIVIRIGNSPRPKVEYKVIQDDGGDMPHTTVITKFPDRTQYRSQGLGEVLSPIRTLLNTREARGETAIKQLNTVVTSLQDEGELSDFIEFQMFENEVALPLGWLLSKKAREEIRGQLGQPRECETIVDIENPCSFGQVISELLRSKQ
jgi:hypothetical protein